MARYSVFLILTFWSALSAVAIAASPFSAEPTLVDHQMTVQLEPGRSWLSVTDRIRLPQVTCRPDQTLKFYLHAGLQPKTLGQVKIKKLHQESSGALPVETYEVSGLPEDCSFTIKYQGVIFHPVVDNESPGTIELQGVSLLESTYWYPVFERQVVTFSLTVQSPAGWRSVSQGEKSESGVWQETQPQDGIYLIAAPFFYYERKSENLHSEVYLRKEDKALAEKYLELTEAYIEMYAKMLGPYPYKKFALVENFWETGFGMPSFTLLGSQVLRLPFIPYTSYPHEILHNWWGNSVYIDFEKGNWAEGLTSYLADHYFSEQKNKGELYRRQVLQDFQDYTRDTKDFPLVDFRSRHNAVSKAIGYGKAGQFFHMLKIQLGEELFFKGLKHFYSENRFQMASYEDLRKSFEAVSSMDLQSIFSQWTTRTGAPQIEIKNAFLEEATSQLQGQRISTQLELAQNPQADIYQLFVPLEVHFADGSVEKRTVTMTERSQAWSFSWNRKPVSLSVDPHFDIFRRLFPQEIPAAFSYGFAERAEVYIVLPSASSDIGLYEKLAQMLVDNYQKQAPKMKIHIVKDSQLEALPQNSMVWLLGWNQRFLGEINDRLNIYQSEITEQYVRFNSDVLNSSEASVFLTVNLSSDQMQTINWVGLNSFSDLQALMRKLPHYDGYSFLAFDKTSTNLLKERWPTKSSPLKVEF